MAVNNQSTGSCLCGAVKLTVRNPGTSIGACHCDMCRKWGGGPLLAVECGSDVTLEGEDNITLYNSSAWAERGFCKHCGTHLFYRLKETRQYHVPAGLFDNEPELTLGLQIFIDEKPPYYRFANETPALTGAEVFAMYAPKPER